MSVHDKLWMWAHEAGSHNQDWNTPAPSRMTPVEGAYYMDLRNLIMVRYNGKPEPPYDQYVRAFKPLSRFVWAIVNASGETSDADLLAAQHMAAKNPNMTGVMMDDFFTKDADNVGVYTAERLAQIRTGLSLEGRQALDLWVVLYQYQLDLPVQAHLSHCDVVTYWTWQAERLVDMEQDFARLEAMAPDSRKVLGCYLWDYGNKKPMPLDLMKHQCAMGLKWLEEGRIEGMIFLASCICDLGLDTVEWTRQWIAEVSDR